MRFHGPSKLYAPLYSRQQLEKWAEKIKPHLKDGDVYLYFNNDYAGRALQNSDELKNMLNR